MINSLAPGRFKINLRKIILKLILVTDGCDIPSKIALIWTSLDLSDDKSTLVQVMAWCHQATSHYLNQCWPRSLPPYGTTGPQWVDITSLLHCMHLIYFSPYQHLRTFHQNGLYVDIFFISSIHYYHIVHANCFQNLSIIHYILKLFIWNFHEFSLDKVLAKFLHTTLPRLNWRCCSW